MGVCMGLQGLEVLEHVVQALFEHGPMLVQLVGVLVFGDLDHARIRDLLYVLVLLGCLLARLQSSLCRLDSVQRLDELFGELGVLLIELLAEGLPFGDAVCDVAAPDTMQCLSGGSKLLE